jgi:hypothetical protein
MQASSLSAFMLSVSFLLLAKQSACAVDQPAHPSHNRTSAREEGQLQGNMSNSRRSNEGHVKALKVNTCKRFMIFWSNIRSTVALLPSQLSRQAVPMLARNFTIVDK